VSTLPAFYVDNIKVIEDRTYVVRGNVVSNCYGSDAIGIEIKNCNTVRAKNNRTHRIRSVLGNSIGLKIVDCEDVVSVYHVSSRCNAGVHLENIEKLYFYNYTSHDCDICGTLDNPSVVSTLRNISLSVYDNVPIFRKGSGFVLSSGSVLDIDYMYHYGIGDLYVGGSVTEGSSITLDKPIYVDEENDDLTPDNLSVLNNAGTDNPLYEANPDIGGIESEVVDEQTTDQDYYYKLLDNTFWDIGNQSAVEVSLIKAFQSRILANCELAVSTAKRDYFIKDAQSLTGFSEIFPCQAYYFNSSKFKKRVMDLWFNTINPSTLYSMNCSIGGYNLFPSYFKRTEDDIRYWLLGSSAVNIDNMLSSVENLRYGITIDVLGLSTMSSMASAECYSHFKETVADAGPFVWTMHNEPQPSGYLLFTDMWNDFERCTLNKMFYNNDFNISPESAEDCSLVTPLLITGANPISGSVTLGPAPSGGGDVELSLLDRIWGESLNRQAHYRLGDSEPSMGSWNELDNVIGKTISINNRYIQFRINVSDLKRKDDYEFMGLCLRPLQNRRVWSEPQEYTQSYIEIVPGECCFDKTNPPILDEGGIRFSDDGVPHICGWSYFVPKEIRESASELILMISSAGLGDLYMQYSIITLLNTGFMGASLVSNFIQNFDGVGFFKTVKINMSGLFNNATTHIILLLTRDSTNINDTLNGNATMLLGKIE